MATLKDIAALAGVSPSTVSRVLQEDADGANKGKNPAGGTGTWLCEAAEKKYTEKCI